MSARALSSAAVALLVLLGACERAARSTLGRTSVCAAISFELDSVSLSGIRVGMHADSVIAHCSVEGDSLTWSRSHSDQMRVITVRVADALLHLAVGKEGAIHEIETGSPSFVTADSIRVGSFLNRIVEAGFDEGAVIEGELAVSHSDHCGLALWIGGVGAESGALLDASELRALPRDLVVRRLTIRPCVR